MAETKFFLKEYKVPGDPVSKIFAIKATKDSSTGKNQIELLGEFVAGITFDSGEKLFHADDGLTVDLGLSDYAKNQGGASKLLLEVVESTLREMLGNGWESFVSELSKSGFEKVDDTDYRIAGLGKATVNYTEKNTSE